MKIAILLSCIAAVSYADDWKWQAHPYAKWHSHGYYRPAPLNKDGTVAETPEVREATAAHLAAVAEARAKAPAGHWYGHWDDWHKKGDWQDWHRPGHWRDDWNRKGDWGVWDRKGEWRDWDGKGDWRDWDRKGDWRVWDRKGDWKNWDNKGWRYGPRWNWKPAPLNMDGTVAETPEVRYLKAQHLAAHAKAEARLSHQGWWSRGPNYAKNHHYWQRPSHHHG